jgi:hypothetical protein
MQSKDPPKAGDKESLFTLCSPSLFQKCKNDYIITEGLRLSIQWPRVLCYDHYLQKILINAKRLAGEVKFNVNKNSSNLQPGRAPH